MCGIVGVVGDFGSDDCLQIVRRMNDALAHRGPDDEGVGVQEGFGFGMRRLSIIDLAGGHQPMWDDDRRFGVVFNGEIYNYRLLRQRIGEAVFRTQSDTELVLRTLRTQGLDAVHEWNGMFAVAAWDATERKLWLLRDRIGKKPLYYFWDGKTFLFASEIKALLASGLVPRRVNRQAVWDYLTFRYVPGPDTVWQGIRKLPPGSALELLPGKPPREFQYWSTDVVGRNGVNGSRANLKVVDREFAELFLDAVQLRLVAADVPVGVLLSGGLDSSAVAAAAVELGHRSFHTFSVGFDKATHSELPYAQQVAQHIGARHHEIVIGQKEFIEALPAVVESADEPLADLASVPLLAVCKLARLDVKVVLSGEGSDEVLAGYDFGAMVRKWETVKALQRVPRPLLRFGSSWARSLLPARYGTAATRIAESPLDQWNRIDLPHMTRLLEQEEKLALWPACNGQPSSRILEEHYAAARAADPLQQMLAVWQKSWLVEDLLMKADKMSMATSLELRTPFLDYRLVEWANRQPNVVKVRRTGLFEYETKSVLRRFCARRLPREILTRPKRGFPVPSSEWLREGLDLWARDMLLGPSSRVGAAFNRDAMARLIVQAGNGQESAARKVWMLIVLEHWLQVWDARLAENA